jgi:Na+/H+-dicarboxylate symporter
VVPLVFTSVATGVASLNELGVSTGTVGWKTVGFYFLTTIVAVAEGLAVTYALMPIWNENAAASQAVTVTPVSASFDSFDRISVVNSEALVGGGYYNASSAASAVFRFPGAVENTTVTSLAYLYESAVSFALPAAVGPSGPYSGAVGEIHVLDAAGVTAFVAPAGSLVITVPESSESGISDSFVNLLYSIVPNNIIGVFYGCVEGGCSPDLLSMIVFAIAFSVGMMAIKMRGDAPDVLLPLFTEVLEITLMLVLLVIKTTPVAVACLILSAIAANPLDALVDALASLGVLLAGLIGAFFFHIIVTMSALSWIFTRTNPYKHLSVMAPAASLAFGCASSAATLPTNILCCERQGFNPSIVRFVLSLGATVSMDGTAIYIPGVIIWLAAQAGIYMSFGEVLVLAIIATLASAGASPTPGLIAIVILCWGSVFPGVPVPPEIAYLAAVDWLVDRCVTTTNILGDSFVTRIMDHLVKREFQEGDGKLDAFTDQMASRVKSMADADHIITGYLSRGSADAEHTAEPAHADEKL